MATAARKPGPTDAQLSKAITDHVRTRYGTRQYDPKHGWFTRIHFSGVDQAIASIRAAIAKAGEQ